jgi:hypothetical protein
MILIKLFEAKVKHTLDFIVRTLGNIIDHGNMLL